MTRYGYARVSSIGQNEDRQLLALIENNIEQKNIFLDKVSGKDFNRPNYSKLIKKLKNDDELYIVSIDRLGRNYDQILEQWRIITKDKHCNIVVLDMPLLDTRQNKDLTGTLISDIVLQLLSYVAQTEREFIKQRQKEGIAVAKQKGVHFGRKAIEKPNNYQNVISMYRKRIISCRVAGELLGVSHKTFLKWVKENGD